MTDVTRVRRRAWGCQGAHRQRAATVIDATNLRRKDRLACVALAGSGEVRYVIIDRPMDVKRRDAGWRKEVPGDLLARHDQTFRSQMTDILSGDHQTNVTAVLDLREAA